MGSITTRIIRDIIGIVNNIIVVFWGVWMVVDDYKDIRKFHHDGEMLRKNPNLWGFIREFNHHWIWGFVAIFGGLAGLYFSIKDLLDALKEIEEKEYG